MLRSSSLRLLAFCTLCLAVFASASPAETLSDTDFNLAFKGLSNLREDFLEKRDLGNVSFPLIARVLHREGAHNIKGGNREQGLAQLRLSTKMDPDFSNAYFTLARAQLTHLDFEGLLHLAAGIETAFSSFTTQHLLAVNGLYLLIVALMVTLILLTFGYCLRYFPFCQHMLREFFNLKREVKGSRFLAWAILLLPLLLGAGAVLTCSFYILIVWCYLRRFEKVFVASLLMLLAGVFLLSPTTKRLSPGLDPYSRLSTIHSAAGQPFDRHAVRRIETFLQDTDPPLRTYLFQTLGSQYGRVGDYESARYAYLKALQDDSTNAACYNNLANIYFLGEQYSRAATGYRRALELVPDHPIPHFNLGQTHIKNLYFEESSQELNLASDLGMDSYRHRVQESPGLKPAVYDLALDNSTLWEICFLEGAEHGLNLLEPVLAPLTLFSLTTSGVVFCVTLVLAFLLSILLPFGFLAFQCSNCGQVACDHCGGTKRGSTLCPDCSEAIVSVSSDRVEEALLRTRRQKVLKDRRRRWRAITFLFPGVPNLYFGQPGLGIFKILLTVIGFLVLIPGGLPVLESPKIETGLNPFFFRIIMAVLLQAIYIRSVVAGYPREKKVQRSREGALTSPKPTARSESRKRYVV